MIKLEEGKFYKFQRGELISITKEEIIEPDLLDDPEYQKFVLSMSKHCSCCPDCGEHPCGSVLAGGPCDDSHGSHDSPCNCDEEYEDEEKGVIKAEFY